MDPSCRYFLILRTRWALGSNKPCVSLLCALTSLEIAYSLSNSRQASVVSAKLRLLPRFPRQSYRVYYAALNSSCSIYRHFHIRPECFSIPNFSLSLSPLACFPFLPFEKSQSLFTGSDWYSIRWTLWKNCVTGFQHPPLFYLGKNSLFSEGKIRTRGSLIANRRNKRVWKPDTRVSMDWL